MRIMIQFRKKETDMSWQDSTYDRLKVPKLVDDMLYTSVEDENVEILISYEKEKKEWLVTKDKKFFSLGFKLEDRIKHLENLVHEVESKLMEASEEVMPKYTIKDVNRCLEYVRIEMEKYKNNQIEFNIDNEGEK